LKTLKKRHFYLNSKRSPSFIFNLGQVLIYSRKILKMKILTVVASTLSASKYYITFAQSGEFICTKV